MKTSTLASRLALRALLPLALAATAAAQNSPDTELAIPYTVMPTHSGRMLDVAYTEDGFLVAAFIEYVPNGSDRIIVVNRDPTTGVWTKLSQSHYMFEHVLELSIAVPGEKTPGPLCDQVYIAAHMAHPSGAGFDFEYLFLISGSAYVPWRGPGRVDNVSNLPVQPPSAWRPWCPSIAVVPTRPSDFTDYAVEIAFMFPDSGSALGGSIYRTTSYDYGRTLTDATKLAGPGASGVNGGPNLRDVAYGHPSVTADERDAETVIAFEDRTLRIVHVVFGPPTASKLNYSFGTNPNDGRMEWAPAIATDSDSGIANLVCLTDIYDPNGGARMIWYSGAAHSQSFTEFGTLDPRAATPADLMIREGELYLTARCYNDNGKSGAPVMVFHGPANGSGTRTRTAVSDTVSNCVQPRVAITPDNSHLSLDSYGFTTRDWTPSWGLDGGYVWVDL